MSLFRDVTLHGFIYQVQVHRTVRMVRKPCHAARVLVMTPPRRSRRRIPEWTDVGADDTAGHRGSGGETQRSMGPVPVVMVHEDTEDPLQVRLVQNQQAVETFRADGAHTSLGDAVGLGRETACERPQYRRCGTPRQNARRISDPDRESETSGFGARSDKVHDTCRAC